jgi:integrase
MSKADKRYLEQTSSGKWRVVVAVPKPLHDKLGTKLKRSLGTDSQSVANVLKWRHVSELKELIAAYESGTPSSNLTAEALALREELLHSRKSTSGPESDPEMVEEVIGIQYEKIRGQPIGEDEEGDPIFDPARQKAASAYAAIATGRETPLDLHSTAFLTGQQWNPRTSADYERIMGYLKEHLDSQGLRSNIEKIDRRVAGEFIGSLEARKMAGKTINKYRSSLSQYWKWLMKRGYADADPWQGQSVKVPRKTDEDKQRPFTDDEMKALFTGKPLQPYMRPLMAIAALSGARLGAIVDLRVKDCTDGIFRFKPQKKEPGIRRVPIHSALVPIIAKLTEGKAPEDDLFPQIPRLAVGANPKLERGMPATKAFGRYRQKVGVHDQPEGARRSLVDFHSFRRWFITKANEALTEGALGFTPWTVAEVAGHSTNEMPLAMTMGVYKAKDKLTAQRACVEAVRLPEGLLTGAAGR